ncbi:unnamed protein product [Gadus morhua 'NCC']
MQNRFHSGSESLLYVRTRNKQRGVAWGWSDLAFPGYGHHNVGRPSPLILNLPDDMKSTPTRRCSNIAALSGPLSLDQLSAITCTLREGCRDQHVPWN